MEAPLRVTTSKHRSGINSLTEDDSVFNSVNGGIYTKIKILFF